MRAADSATLISVSEIRAGNSSLNEWQQVSSGQPDADTLDVLQAAGFTTVIDIRTAGEDRGINEAAEVASRNMTYINMPIGGPSDINYENARELDRLLNAIEGPVLVHCQER